MKKNDEIIVTVQERNFPNKGIGYLEDNKIIIKNTLVGQKVSAKINKKRNNAIEARLLTIIEKAPYEIESKCSHFDLCGGCSYQTIPYEQELKLKKEQVLTLLKNAEISDFQFEGIECSPNETAYRNKCEFSFGDEEKGGQLALGMRKRQSFYEVVNLKNCNIVDEDFLKIISATVDFFRQKQIPFYHKSRHDGQLRHLVVRKASATQELLVNLITTSKITFSLEEWKEMLLNLKLNGSICGILHTSNDSVADVVKSDETTLLFGRDYFIEKLFDLTFQVSAFSFFQTNSKGAEKLYSIVKEFAGDIKNKIVFDLYCGTGTIAQIISHNAKEVIGIEIVEEAIEAAKENAIRNQITNCEFIAGDVLKKVEELSDKPDLIILDPPRDGIHVKAIDKIIRFRAKEIIYVSCKPTSLVRDLKIFQENGYKIEKIKLMDMFPRTVHIETIVKMTYDK